MSLENLERIAYIVSPSEKIAFSSKRIVVNFVPNGECTNQCVFCRTNIPAMIEFFNGEVLLNREYSIDEMVRAVTSTYQKYPDCSEVIVTGTIGEPLLYLDKLLRFVPEVKGKTFLPVRLNTNGQATIIHPEYSSQDVCEMLEKAGLDTVAVSLNAINERDYTLVCRPKQPHSFDSVLDFIRVFNKSRIGTYVSFVDYSKTHQDLPRLDRKTIKDFCQTLGLSESQIIYRHLIE